MPDSIRSFCGAQAAPRICLGKDETVETVIVFTCAKNPQKSQMRSAHLKFGGKSFNVLGRLHLGHMHLAETNLSPHTPSCCLVVAMASQQTMRPQRG